MKQSRFARMIEWDDEDVNLALAVVVAARSARLASSGLAAALDAFDREEAA